MINKPTILILFGASGDLSKRYILKAVNSLGTENQLPKDFKIIGTTRRNLTKKDILKDIKDTKYLESSFDILQVSETKKSFLMLKEKVLKEFKGKKKAQILFYLSVPPQVSKKIVKLLNQTFAEEKKQIKILIEKPFGTNYQSAKKLISDTNKYFSSSQIYRIDHYLFKKIIGEILEFKSKNKYIWDKKLISKIEVEALEEMGVEHRTNFYEKTGAINDMIQSHLLEVLSVVLLKSNKTQYKDLPNKRLESLKGLSISNENTILGQYEGYKNETENQKSKTETFAYINLKYSGFPKTQIKIITGKNLDRKESSVQIHWVKNGIQNSKTFSEKDRKYNSYEDVLLNAINSNKEFFVSEKEILTNWLIVSKIKKKTLVFYKKGAKVEEITKL